MNELLELDTNTWNRITVYKQMRIDKNKCNLKIQ